MKPTTYDTRGRKAYEKQRDKGWKNLSVLGPPEMITAVQQYIKKYKIANDLYERKVSGETK